MGQFKCRLSASQHMADSLSLLSLILVGCQTLHAPLLLNICVCWRLRQGCEGPVEPRVQLTAAIWLTNGASVDRDLDVQPGEPAGGRAEASGMPALLCMHGGSAWQAWLTHRAFCPWGRLSAPAPGSERVGLWGSLSWEGLPQEIFQSFGFALALSICPLNLW